MNSGIINKLMPKIQSVVAARFVLGHTGGRSHRISHPPSFCGACLNFLARRIQPFLSLIDREVEFLCTND